jgi:hypothetical protein
MTYSLTEESVMAETRSVSGFRRVDLPLDQILGWPELVKNSSRPWFWTAFILGAFTAVLISAGPLSGTGLHLGLVDGIYLSLSALAAGMWARGRKTYELFHFTAGGYLAVFRRTSTARDAEAFAAALQDAKIEAIREKVRMFFPDEPAAAKSYLGWLRDQGILTEESLTWLGQVMDPPARGSAGFGPG